MAKKDKKQYLICQLCKNGQLMLIPLVRIERDPNADNEMGATEEMGHVLKCPIDGKIVAAVDYAKQAEEEAKKA